MSNDQRTKSTHRYSRFSQLRSEEEETATPPPPEPPQEEFSLAELTERSLNRYQQAAPSQPWEPAISQDNAPFYDSGWDQPPPPEPSAFWQGEAQEPSKRPARHDPDPSFGVPDHPEPSPHPHNGSPQAHPSQGAKAPRDEAPRSGAKTAAAAEPVRPVKTPKRRKATGDTPNKKDGPSALTRMKATLMEKKATLQDKAVPAVANGALKIAQGLQRKEIRKRYNRLLVMGHTRVADRHLEKLFFVPSRKAEVIDPAPERAIHYDGPIPGRVFKWIMALMPDDLRQFAFIDIRAGRGRTSLLAARRAFKRILAYEYDEETFDDLQMNVAQYPRSYMICRDIDCYRGDLDGISLPDQPCVIWFSGAWREPMLRGVMNYVRDTYRQSPRRIYVVLENTAEDTGLEQDSIFDLVEPSLMERLKLQLLSPMRFKVYRSIQ